MKTKTTASHRSSYYQGETATILSVTNDRCRIKVRHWSREAKMVNHAIKGKRGDKRIIIGRDKDGFEIIQ